MKTCNFCGAEMNDDHPYLIGEKLDGHAYGWEYWADQEDGEQTSVPGVGVVTVVAKHVRYGEDQGEDDRPVFIIFEINGQFYRKNGTADSYGEVSWLTGGFLPAVKKTVTKKVFE